MKRAPLPSSSSTVGFLPPEKKTKNGRNRCGKSYLVVALLVFFVIVSIVMIVLYFARDSQDGKVTENGGTTQETVNIKLLLYVVL